MKQDELLDDLGRLARAQAEQGEADAADAAELLRPLDAAAHDRIMARLLPLVGQGQAGEAAQAGGPGPAPGDARVTGTAARPHAARAAARWSRPRRWLMAAAPALAAAATLLWFAWPQAGAPLPAYGLELSGGRSAERGATAGAILRVGPGDRVSAVLRPVTAVSGAVAVRVFVNRQALPDAGLRVEQSADGALRVSGLGPPLAALAPGRHRLDVVVGRPGSLPESPPGAEVAEGVQLLSYEVERLPP